MTLMVSAYESKNNNHFENNDNKFRPLDSGTYDAVCDGIASVGPIYNQTFHNIQNIVYIKFDAKLSDGSLKDVWLRRTQSIHPKSKLCKELEMWRGRGFTEEERRAFNLASILGVSARIVVQQNTGRNGKTYADIVAILPPANKVEAPDTWTFDIADPARENYDKLPKFIKNIVDGKDAEKIAKKGEADNLQNAGMKEDLGDIGDIEQSISIDDIPF